MSQFDIDAYLRSKNPPADPEKLASIQRAKDQKIVDLTEKHNKLLYKASELNGYHQRAKESWVGQLGLDPEGVAGTVVNGVASLVSGTTRAAANLMSLAPDLMAVADENNMSQEEVTAYSNYKKGIATPEEMAILNTKKAFASKNDNAEAKLRGQQLADASPDSLTTLQIFERAQKLREVGRAINEGGDYSSIVHQGARTDLNNQLGDNFQAAWDQTGLGNLFEKDKKIGDAKDIAIGLGKLIYNAGEAAVTNPKAAAEYMAENLPQLLVGGQAKYGKTLLTAMNAGYAIDNYQQGIQNYAAKNNGALPDEETRTRMAMHAAGTFVAEHLGELGQLKAIGKVADIAAAPKTGIVAGTKNVLKAGATGAAEEAVTEGYQTYAEGEAQLKPASAKDVYTGAVIGGVSGGGLSAGGRTIGEIAGTTPEQIQEKERQKTDFKESADTGDVSKFLDPKSRDYSPTKAASALYVHSRKEDTTPEVKAENLKKVDEILSGLRTKQDQLRELADATSPEALTTAQAALAKMEEQLAATNPTDTAAVKKLTDDIEATKADIADSADNAGIYAKTKEKLAALDRDFQAVEGVRSQLDRLVNGTQSTDVTSSIEAADSKVDTNDAVAVEASKKAIDHVITLSMSAPEQLSPEAINRLVNNQNNGLSAEQRNYLRTFSEAQVAELALKDMGQVASEILYGSKNGKNIGLVEYRNRIQDALKQGNTEEASRLLDLLGSFAENHKLKSEALQQAAQAYEKTNQYQRIERTQDGKWVVKQGFFPSAKAQDENGGLNVGAGVGKLLNRIPKEAAAIARLQESLTQGMNLRSSGPVKRTVGSVAPSTTPAAPATASPAPAAPVVSEAPVEKPKAAKPTLQEKELKKAERAQRKVIRNNPVSLWTKLKNSLNDVDLNEIYGSEWKKRYTSLKNKDGGRSIVDMVADGLLDEFLPPKLRSSVNDGVSNPSWETEAEQHIKEMMRGQNYLTYDTQMEAKAIGLQIQELEQEIANGTLTKEDIENELESLEASETEQTTEGETETNASTTEATQVEQESSTGDSESVAAEDEQPASDLDVLQNKTPDKPYQEKNLIADFFKQVGEGSPLVAMKNFMSQLKDGTVDVLSYVDLEQLNDFQQAAWDKFQLKAKTWQKAITANLGKKVASQNDALYRYKDLMQFFIIDGDVEENVKTAMTFAAFSYISEKGGQLYNTPEEINLILGRDTDHEVTDLEMTMFAMVGSRQNVVANALGQRAVQALGLKPRSDAPANLMSQLQSVLGAHVMKLLMDKGILQRTSYTSAVMSEFTNASPDEGTNFQFVRLARQDSKLVPEAEEIFTATKGSQQLLEKVFKADIEAKEPSLKPIPFKQKQAKNSSQEIPKKLAEVVAQKNKEASYLRQDMWQLLTQLGEDVIMGIAGVKSVDPANTHKSKMIANQAKNDGLKREWGNFKDWIENVLGQSDEGFDSPMYFEHTVWNQQRVGIASTVINPQSSKVQRHLLFRKSWTATFDTENPGDNFKLRVLEGFGVKTDKKSNEDNLKSWESKTGTPAIKAAVAALVKALNGDSINEAEQTAILKGVKEAGENFHSLDALMALAHQQYAKEQNRKTFEFQGMTEVDGVTNGPMLSHLLLGAAESVAKLFAMVNKGGFFQKGSSDTQYNIYRGQPGRQDLYETTTGHVTAGLQKFTQEGVKTAKGKVLLSGARATSILGAIYTFTGSLTDDKGAVVKAGRNIIKTPLTAMVFGSTITKAVDSMADAFIESIYSKFEEVAAGTADRVTVLKQLSVLGVHIDSRTAGEDLLEMEFTKDQINTIKQSFGMTMGMAVRQTMEKDFGVFMERRNAINHAAKISFEVYNAIYQPMRKAFIAERIKDVNATTGKPLRDLTSKEEAELQAKVDAVFPIMQTLLSNDSNQPKAGLFAPKTERKLSTSDTFKSEVHFRNPFNDNPNKPAFSTVARGYEYVAGGPGARLAVMSVHSLDSAISHYAAKLSEVLNVHDAHGAGWAMLDQTAQNLNQATWNALLSYSPAKEARLMLSKTLVGAAQMLNSSEVSDEVKASLKAALQKLAIDEEVKADELLGNALTDIADVQAIADKTKLEALSQMTSIDQYAFEGGNYLVTEADRTKAAEALSEVTEGLTEEEADAIKTINQIALGAQTTRPKSDFGQLGTPMESSDPDLVALLEKTGTATAREVIQLVYEKLKAGEATGLNAFNLKLASTLARLVPAGLEVKYITAQSAQADVLSMPSGPNTYGWYVQRNGKEAVYVLGQEFRHSKITPELMLHELLHAALANTIQDALEGAKNEATELVAELQSLLDKAKAYATEQKIEDRYAAALSNVHELVSWGLTNKDFQRDVLTKITMQSKTTGNKLVDGMKHFINSLAKFLFKKPTEAQNNGLFVLVSNATGLMNYANQNKTSTDINLSMAAETNVSTLDIHEALGDGTIDPAFDTHLKGLLKGIVEAIHGPFGTLKAMVEQTSPKTPLEAFHAAQKGNVTPFASEALKGGFKISAQEAFVIDQVQATTRVALEGNEGELSAAYAELGRLYTEARAKLKEQDFSKDPEKQALFDFAFGITSRKDGRSDYLSRFAALGLAHKEFREMLGFNTKYETRTVGEIKGIPEKLFFLFNRFLNFFNSRVTHTYNGQRADQKLTTLVEQLVHIETRRKQTILKFDTQVVGDFIEANVRKGAEALKRKVGDFGESEFFQKSSNEFVKLAGNVMSVVGHERAEQLIDTIAKYRDYLVRDKQGVVAGLLTQVRGVPETFERMLRATKLNEKARKNIMNWTAKTVLDSFADKEMSDGTKEAITNVFLRTDMAALLSSMTMEDLVSNMENQSKFDKTVSNLEAQLTAQFPAYAEYFKQAARDLGYFMVTGKAVSEHLMLNAGNIAHMYGTQHQNALNTAQVQAAEKLIDQLTTLRAIQYTDGDEKKTAMKVFKTEMARTDGANGIAMLLNTHLNLQKDSRERLFQGTEISMMKGYLPDITDPNVDVKVATAKQAKDLIDQGYVQLGEVRIDPKDYNQDERFLFVLRDGGLNPHTTGIFSLTSLQNRGTEVFMASATHQALVKNRVHQVTSRMFAPNRGYDPSTVGQTFAVPVLDMQGQPQSYRYMMQHLTKDTALRRDNRFEKLLGAMAGGTLDKVLSADQNTKAVQALKDFYEADVAEHPDSYLLVGLHSRDPELREVWKLLPMATKMAALKVWGPAGMMVRNDMLDINFGYRKISLADLWEKTDPNSIEKPTKFEKLFMDSVEAALYFYARNIQHQTMADSERYQKRAAQVTRRAERIWQEIVHEAKDIIVMKTGTVMIGNILSNISLLMMNGVPFVEIVKTHRIAMKGALDYQRDQEDLFRLKEKLATKQTNGQEAEIEHQIKRLEDSIARNPVRELIEAGLMPSIVEDVAAEEDIYSYKTELVRKAEGLTKGWNPKVVAAGRVVYMAHDTKLYQWLNHTTQLSDFVARYTLYQHLTTKKNALSKADAIQQASDSFINYDIPAHRTMQYLDDMGILMFTKYFLRIQKVLLKLVREHPTRVFGMMIFDHYVNLLPLVTESSALAHLGNNPFHAGAFQFPTVLDDLATVHAGLQLFK